MTRRNKGRGSISKTSKLIDETPPCVHIEKSITPSKVKNNFPHAVFGRCSECPNKDEISLCLKCGKQFCAPHAGLHTNLNNHSLSYALNNGAVHCRKCARTLEHSVHSSITRTAHIIEDMVKKQSSSVPASAPVSPPPPPPPIPAIQPEKVENGTAPGPPPPVEPTIKGLKNTGVICFFNSVLQNLVQTPMLRACLEYTCEGYPGELKSEKYGDMKIDVPGDNGSGMSHKYYSFLRSLDLKERSKPLYPHQVFQEMCSYNDCLSSGQQDAQEAYHALLHSMSSEEGKRRKNAVLSQFGCMRSNFKDLPKDKRRKIQEFANLSRNETFINQLFGGSTINHITCLSCSSVTKTKDHFMDLSVPMPKKEDIKPYRKKQRSGEGTLSKHQKKKQQKENRKKDKGNKREKQKSEISSSAAALADNPVPPPPSSPAPPPSSPTEQVEIPHINGDCCDDLTSTEDVPLLVEELPEKENTDDLVEDELTISPAGDPRKLEDIVVSLDDSPKLKGGGSGGWAEGGRKLRGGISLFDEEDADVGLSCLFAQEEEEEEVEGQPPTSPACNGEVDGLTQLFDDLDIDTSDYGEDTLDACLAQFCREELLSGDNQFSCLNCGKQASDRDSRSLNVSYAKSNDSFSEAEEEEEEDEEEDKSDNEEIKPVKVDAKCRYFLYTLPPILVIHLKRFALDNRGHLQKDRRHINYPLDLNLDRFVLTGGGNRYRLFGVVDHSGSLHRGHYIAYVRKRDVRLDENLRNRSAPISAQIKLLGQINAEAVQDPGSSAAKWYCCNDERISEVNVKKVLSADAYLLFYERCSPFT